MDETDIVEIWTERSAIREYDGGMSRERADYLALRDVRAILGEIPECLLKMAKRST